MMSARYPLTGRSTLGPTFTMLLEWQTRVVMRRSTGVSKSSEIFIPSMTMSLASWLSEGSRMTTLAARPMSLLSCSFWLECMPGSSADTITMPPVAPM
jgi:hypothetical protein